MKTNFFLTLLVLLSVYHAPAQLINEKQLRVPFGYNETVKTQTLGDKGMAIMRTQDETLYVDFYDTDLNLLHSDSVTSGGYRLETARFHKGELQILLLSLHLKYKLFKFNVDDYRKTESSGELVDRPDHKYDHVKTYPVNNGWAIVCAFDRSFLLPRMVLLDTDKETAYLETFTDRGTNNVNFIACDYLPETAELMVYVKVQPGTKKEQFICTRYDSLLQKREVLDLSASFEGISVSEIDATYLGDGEYLHAGTFYYQKSRKLQEAHNLTEEVSGRSHGFFSFRTMDGAVEGFHQQNFLDFEHYIDFLDEKDQNRIREKLQRNDKEIYSFNTMMLIHNIAEFNGSYVCIAEAYDYGMSSMTRVSTPFSANGMPPGGRAYTPTFTHTSSSVSSYVYSHTVVISFKADGTVNWLRTFYTPNIDLVSDHSSEQVERLPGTDTLRLIRTNRSLEYTGIDTDGELKELIYRVELGPDDSDTLSDNSKKDNDSDLPRRLAGFVSPSFYWYGNYIYNVAYKAPAKKEEAPSGELVFTKLKFTP